MPMLPNDNPTVDPRVKVGPMEERAGRRYFLVKHAGTNRVFRIGEKEQFMLTCMNGTQDVDEIGRRYEARFLNRMTPASWEQLFALFRQRSLLISSSPAPVSDSLPSRRFTTSREGLFEWKVRLTNPQAMLAQIEPKLRFLFRPAVLVVGLLLIIASEAWVGLHIHLIYSQLANAGHGHWARIASYVIPFSIVGLVLHELSHAMACQHLGGTVNDMGIIFRYVSFYPYTRVDDVMFFHNRLDRIYVLSAGMFSTLLFSIPFVALWIAVSNPYAKAACGILIFSFGFGTLINLIPFVQLDGYWILTTLLRMPDLRQDSYIVWKSIGRRTLGTQTRWPSYTRRELTICLIYGALSAVVSLFVTVVATLRWHRLFARAGNAYAWILVLLLMTTFAVLKIRRSKSAPARHGIGARVAVD